MRKQNSSAFMIRTLARRSFQANRMRNAVAVLAIILTTMMFTVLFVLAQSIKRNVTEMTFRQTGYDGQISFKGIGKEELEAVASRPEVAAFGESLVVGIAENKELAGKQVEIRWSDDYNAKHSFSYPQTGTMPMEDDEIVLDVQTLERLGVPCELGAEVTLFFRRDITGQEKTQAHFRLSGYYETNASTYASMAWVSRSFAERMIEGAEGEGQVIGMRTAQLSLHTARNMEAVMDKILAETGLTGLDYNVNLAYSPEMNYMAAQEGLPMYLGMALVFVAGYLIIYNVFQISITADIQFYGRLKTLGTDNKQIRRMIYGQGMRLSLIGIPAGLMIGYLVGALLVPVFISFSQENARVPVSPVIFIGSALFSYLTVMISCLRPARIAGKVSPMEALRYNGTEGGRRKIKKSKKGASLPAMAFSNLGRNRRRTAVVILSLTLGLVLLSCFYAKNASFDMEKYLEELTLSDFELSELTSEDYSNGYDPRGNTLSAELIGRVEGLEGLEGLGHLYSHETAFAMDEQTAANLESYFSEERLAEWAGYDPEGPKMLKEAISSRQAAALILGLDGIALEKTMEEYNILAGSYDAEVFSGGGHVIAVSTGTDGAGENPVYPTASLGTEIELEGEAYTVMAIVKAPNPVTKGASEKGNPKTGHELKFIIPAADFQARWPENTPRRLFVNVSDEGLAKAQKMLEQYTDEVDRSLPVTSRSSMAKQYERETRSQAVMGNVISIVIALVGILNFANSMITAIISRKKEFAMIQSVGMTRRQLTRMLIYEGLFYAVITLAVSFAASIPGVGIGVRAMVEGGFTTFRFTLLPLYVCTPILLVLVAAVPCLCFKNLEKESVVERLRAVD